MNFKNIGMLLATVLVASTTAFAGGLPEGVFKGDSDYRKTHGNPVPSTAGRAARFWGDISSDFMGLFIRKDPKVPGRYHAILAEYNRGYFGFTVWYNRMYIYQLDQIDKSNDLDYAVRPLRLSPAGEITADYNVVSDRLTLAKAGTLNGAVMSRSNYTNKQIEETIKFNGLVASSWEDYIPGHYLSTEKREGQDYLSKEWDTYAYPSHEVAFFQRDIRGLYDISEKIPGAGIFSFRKSSKVDETEFIGADKLLNKIVVFVDIMNWKSPKPSNAWLTRQLVSVKPFTNDEMMLINPENAYDVGFYYEREVVTKKREY